MSKENNLTDFLTDFANGIRKLWGWGDEDGKPRDDTELINPQEFIDETWSDDPDRPKWLERPDTLDPANIRAKDDEGNPITIFGVSGAAMGEPEPPLIDLHSGVDEETGEHVILAYTTGHEKFVPRLLSTLDKNFKPENIKYGTTIQGVDGTFIGNKVDPVTLTITNNTQVDITFTYTPSDYLTSKQIEVKLEPNASKPITCFRYASITIWASDNRLLSMTCPQGTMNYAIVRTSTNPISYVHYAFILPTYTGTNTYLTVKS